MFVKIGSRVSTAINQFLFNDFGHRVRNTVFLLPIRFPEKPRGGWVWTKTVIRRSDWVKNGNSRKSRKPPAGQEKKIGISWLKSQNLCLKRADFNRRIVYFMIKIPFFFANAIMISYVNYDYCIILIIIGRRPSEIWGFWVYKWTGYYGF